MTACIRNLFYMAQDIKNLLWPSQLTAVVRGRDYEHAVKKAREHVAELIAEKVTADAKSAASDDLIQAANLIDVYRMMLVLDDKERQQSLIGLANRLHRAATP